MAQVLRLDPSLLIKPDYVATYPTLAAFLAQHPEVAHNPVFFLGGTGDASYSDRSRAMSAVESVLLGMEFMFGSRPPSRRSRGCCGPRSTIGAGSARSRFKRTHTRRRRQALLQLVDDRHYGIVQLEDVAPLFGSAFLDILSRRYIIIARRPASVVLAPRP